MYVIFFVIYLSSLLSFGVKKIIQFSTLGMVFGRKLNMDGTIMVLQNNNFHNFSKEPRKIKI